MYYVLCTRWPCVALHCIFVLWCAALVRTDLTGLAARKAGTQRSQPDIDRGYFNLPNQQHACRPLPPLCGPFGGDANRDLRCINQSTVSPRQPITSHPRSPSKTLFPLSRTVFRQYRHRPTLCSQLSQAYSVQCTLRTLS